MSVIGDDDLLWPTPMRICWLLAGLVSALTLGFLLGMILPRRQATVSGREDGADAAMPGMPAR